MRRGEVGLVVRRLVAVDCDEPADGERERERLRRRVRPQRLHPLRPGRERAELEPGAHAQGHEQPEAQGHERGMIGEQHARVEEGDRRGEAEEGAGADDDEVDRGSRPHRVERRVGLVAHEHSRVRRSGYREPVRRAR